VQVGEAASTAMGLCRLDRLVTMRPFAGPPFDGNGRAVQTIPQKSGGAKMILRSIV